MAAALRALGGYFFLVFIVRIVGRRPGKQMTPFEFVLVFFMGGLALTAMVGNEVSFTNALCQIIAIALGHYLIVWGRQKSSRFARLVDGTPLFLMEKGKWRSNTMTHMGVADDDIMAAARDSAIPNFDGLEMAILERNGEISVAARRDDQ